MSDKRILPLALLAVLTTACSTDAPTGATTHSRDVSQGILVPAGSAFGYGVSLLPLPSGYTRGMPADINNSGIIVGSVLSPRRAAMWSGRSATLLQIGSGETGSHATSVNRWGVAAGFASVPVGQSLKFRPKRWQGSAGQYLALGNRSEGVASDINDAGAMVGWTKDASGNQFPARWDASGNILTDLPLPAGALRGYADGINNTNDIVGTVHFASGGHKPIRWLSNGTVLFNAGAASDRMFAINDAGSAVGQGQTAAVTISPNGISSALWPAAFTGAVVAAFDISSKGRIVGTDGVVARWSKNGTVSAFPSIAGGQSPTATGINSCGTAVGWVLISRSRKEIPVKWSKTFCD